MQDTIKRVLISGASIAGPTLAFWLHKYGIAATVVEKSKSLRGGGYPIDIRGTAIDVIERMGLVDQVRTRQYRPATISVLDGDGRLVGKISGADLTGAETGRDVEIRRGDLGDILYEATRDYVDYRFNNEIESLVEHSDGVEVLLADGARERFDLVIGADGLHSKTRSLAFGELSGIEKYIGYCFAGFTIGDPSLAADGAAIFNVPGKLAAIVIGEHETVGTCILAFKYPTSPFKRELTDRQRRDLTASMFEGIGWHVPKLVDEMRRSEDLFFDSISQIHMPSWSIGRVALIGDAAHATSFLSGQGSSMATVSAYMLAGEIATSPDYKTAFRNFEMKTRPFVQENQALVDEGVQTMFPDTDEELVQRNMGIVALSGKSDLPADTRRSGIYSRLKLPDFS